MTSFNSFSCALALVGLACAPGSISTVSAETTDKVHETFSVQSDGTLTIEIRHGRIDVKTSPSSEVTVDIVRAIRAASKSKEQELLDQDRLEVSASDSDVTIKAPGVDGHRNGWSFWSLFRRDNIKRDYRYTVTVPEHYNVDLKTSGGGIAVTGVAGGVTTRTSGGGLTFTGIDGSIEGRTSGGGITLESCSGEISVRTSGGGIKALHGSGSLKLKTSGGGITVSNHRGDVEAKTSGGGITTEQVDGKLEASTSGGPIRATFQTAPQAECRLHTSGGGITVSIPDGAAFNLDASTSGGGVRCDFPVTVQGEMKRNRLSGPVNGGGPLIHLRTSGGGIRVSTL